MKKISLLLVVLLAAGSASLYGQMMVGTDFSISGDATATGGYNIDNEQFGFKNEANANIKFEVVAKNSANNSEKVGMEGWVGSIELKDFKIIIDSDDGDSDLRYKAAECQNVDLDGDGIKKNQLPPRDCPQDWDGKEWDKTSRSGLIVTEPDIVAKLKNGPLFLKIHSAPENKADLVAAIEDDDNTEGDPTGKRDAESDDVDNDVGLELKDHAGVSLGYDSDELMVAVGVTSRKDWSVAKDDVSAGTFALSGELGFTLGDGLAGLKMQVVQGIAGENETDLKADDTGVATELKSTFDGITLTAGADVHIHSGTANDPATAENEAMAFEVGLGADVKLQEVMDAKTTLGAKYLYSSKQNVASDVKVTLDDNGGLVDRLGMGLIWGLFDLNNGDMDGPDTENDQMDMFVEGKLSYKLDAMGGTLTPEAKLTLNKVDDAEATVGLSVKAVLTDAVPATEFGLMWKTAQLTGDMEARKDGEITAWAKITYG